MIKHGPSTKPSQMGQMDHFPNKWINKYKLMLGLDYHIIIYRYLFPVYVYLLS